MGYKTKDEVINMVIIPSLGNRAHEYDHNSIFEWAYRYEQYMTIDLDGRQVEFLPLSGYRCTVTMARYWEIVRECEIKNPEPVTDARELLNAMITYWARHGTVSRVPMTEEHAGRLDVLGHAVRLVRGCTEYEADAWLGEHLDDMRSAQAD